MIGQKDYSEIKSNIRIMSSREFDNIKCKSIKNKDLADLMPNNL